MSFKTFEEIEAWQEARFLAKQIRVFCARAHAKKDWSWVDQITRSALSILANIAEGNDCQTNAEFVCFLGYAKRSAAEVRSHLYYGLDQGYVLQDEFVEASTRAKLIGAQLAKLIQYLKTHDRPAQQ